MIKELLSKKYAKWVIIAIIVIIAAWVIVALMTGGKQASTSTIYNTVERGDIELVISGSGVVAPIERYDINPMVKGNILAAPFNEGDTVLKDDILYRIDDEDLRISIEKTRNSIERTKIANGTNDENLSKLTVKAPVNGKVTGLSAKEGDNLNGKLCELINNQELKVKVPFSGAQIKSISEGDSVTLVSADYMSSFNGRVTYVSNSPTAGATGGVFYDVEITADNPGAIPKGTKVVAVAHTTDGDVESTMEGTIDYQDTVSVMAESQGKIKTINVKEGQYVTKGTVIATLENDSLLNTRDKGNIDLKDANLTLASQEKQIDDYNIKSPISGTVISKKFKAGDTINAGSDSVILMTVVDMSKMVFEISADELDIAKIRLGQQVAVTADALVGQNFTGTITNIAGEGTSANGVTTYKVKVTIDSPGALRPGMNVDAKIVIEKRDNVLMVPIAAVVKGRTTSYVFVKDTGNADNKAATNGDSTSRPNRRTQQASGDASSAPTDAGVASSSASPSASPERGSRRSGGGSRTNGGSSSGNSSSSGNIPSSVTKLAPAGTRIVAVEVGINDDSNIEILSGLNEGDEIAMPAIKTSATANSNMMGGGGGMPTGGLTGNGNRQTYGGGGTTNANRS